MRLFIAVEIPYAVCGVLRSMQGSIRIPGRATRTGSFHLTLKFLGDVDQKILSDLVDSLSQIEFETFEARLSDVGTFPNIDDPRVLWVGLEPHERINSLQKDVDSATQRLGFRSENRFHPHITIARIKFLDDKAGFKEAVRSAIVPSAVFDISSFALIRSNLAPSGPVYEVLREFNAKTDQ